MTFKAFGLAAVAAVSMAFAGAANAVAVDVGTVGATDVEQQFQTDGQGVSFFDTVNFDVASGGTLHFSIGDLLVPGSGSKRNNDTLAFTLWDNHHPNGLITYGTGDDTGTGVYDFALPTAGLYHFDIESTTLGSLGGRYGVVLSFTAAAVPEPESYALMLAGLGAVGFMARRRQAK